MARQPTVPCNGGCGTKAVNHIPGSEIAKQCRKGSKRRSLNLGVRNKVRNQKIKVKTVANDAIGYHNTIVRWSEKIVSAMLRQGYVHKLHIPGYDKQTEEFLYSNDDPQYNQALSDMDKSLRDYTDDPTPETKEAMEDKYDQYRQASELRYLRLVEQGRVYPDFNWERAVDIHCAKVMAVHKYNKMTPQEREEHVRNIQDQRKAEEAASQAQDSSAGAPQEAGVVPERKSNGDNVEADEGELHIEFSEETTLLGARLLKEEMEAEQAQNPQPKLIVPPQRKPRVKLFTPDDEKPSGDQKLILPDDPEQWNQI